MPIISEAASAIRSRFGFNKPPDNSPAIPKSVSKDTLFKSSSSSLNFDEVEEHDSVQSFELEEDLSFWKDHNVQVIIRIRPLSNYEVSIQGNSKCVRQDSSQTITWSGPPESRFTFDHVADENVTQENLFKVAGLPMVENCMGGYNSCMFAYGQEKESRRDEKLKYTCKCSFLEIYNEQILDLLDPSSVNLQGSANRKVAATNMNRASSRSHSVFTCIIESKCLQWESQGVTHHRFARLNLVDLAGSERQKSSGAEGERLKEATNINKSLSTLGLVIMNLVNLSNGKSLHVPYRDSKLTFLLQAIVNEDASGDVLTMRIQIQQLKKEVSRLHGLVNGGTQNKENDSGPICFPGSPGSFKWEALQGSFSPLTSDKRISQKKEYETALVGAFRRDRDREIAMQALAAENQAALQLAKKREEEIQGLKMRLRFREAGIKRLEAVASGKISAETHLLQEKEEYLKEIEVLRGQVDRNQEVTRFKSFYDEGERERMSEQIMTLQNKLLEALDWKLMHESDPGKNESSDLEALEDSLLTSSKEPRSSWRSSMKEENEFLRLQAIQNQSEMETLQRKLNSFLEEKGILERRIEGLVIELEEEKKSASNINEEMRQLQLLGLPPYSTTNDHPSDVTFNDQMELKTMVDAIAAASQQEAEAHETAIALAKENDDLRAKLKAVIEDNKKLIELYEVASAEVSKVRDTELQKTDNHHIHLADQLKDLHEENEKLMGLYEKAMKERDEYQRMIFSSGQCNSEIKEEFDCPEKLVEVDGGRDYKFDELPHMTGEANMSVETGITGLIEVEESCIPSDPIADAESQVEAQAKDVTHFESSEDETRPYAFKEVEVSEDLVMARNKLENARDKLENAAEALPFFSSLERMLIVVDILGDKIKVAEESILAKQQEIAGLKHISSQMQNNKYIAQNKLVALKTSASDFSSSIVYWEQREARARARVDSSHGYVIKKKEALVLLQAQRAENGAAIRKAEETELELREYLASLNSKLEKENLRKESEKVLFTIENLDKISISAQRNWHFDCKATELLKAEEERTRLHSEMKQYKEKLSFVLKEIEDRKRKSKKFEADIEAVEGVILTGTQSVKEMEVAYQTVIEEREVLKEMSESGIDEVQKLIVECHQCVFESDLKDREIEILEQEVQSESNNIEELKANMVTANQNKAQLLDNTRSFFKIVNEENESWSISEKLEEVLQEARMSVLEAESLLGDAK
ncbi:hypothetical protein IFM89_007357 [Coptis chinensis]|uniref:Kinesin motor domain-containing protein n=1 Tax=Coptis chinensis TaxID=261450 RepID=A0A835LGN8_9MAGN|nr:hypothetical protein IFM89_007357 [Coptis chinensis]